MTKLIHLQLLWFFLTAFNGIYGLKVNLQIKEYVLSGRSTAIKCLYSLEGNETLQSIKFYKDGNEFSRYTPAEGKPIVFPLPGVNVNIQNSSSNIVELENVNLQSSGIYNCEVTTGPPTISKLDGNSMTVVVLPEIGPEITSEQSQYKTGDELNVNCSCVRSKPAPFLMWYINGDQAYPNYLKKYPTFVDSDDLESALLGMKFTVKKEHFKNGFMDLRCLAFIGEVYMKRNYITFKEDATE